MKENNIWSLESRNQQGIRKAMNGVHTAVITTREATYYEIRIAGYLTDHWSDWFEGLEIHNHPDGGTTLRGQLVDQSALFGVLNRIHALNLTLISVHRSSPYSKE